MYDLGDFGKSFDPSKAGKGLRIPRFPKTVQGQFQFDLKRLVEKEGDTAGKMFEATLLCTASNCEQVMVGGTYTKAYFQGASKVDREKCWRKLLPLLLSATGKDSTDVEALNNAPVQLGELLSLSTPVKETGYEGVDLDLPVRLSVKLESARPDKATGKVDPKFLDDNGQPKIFQEDSWSVAPATAA